MKRRVIKQGHNTLTITLPSKWVKKHGVKPGDELAIDENGATVSISVSEKKAVDKKFLDITDYDIFLGRELYSLYKKGYDEIEITSKNPKFLNRIQQILTEYVVGFEIIRQTSDRCVIKNVAEVQVTEFDSILRRTIYLLISMGEGIIEAMENEDIDPLPNLVFMERRNNRYTGFLRRVLNKSGYPEARNDKLMYSFVEFIEKIADEYKYLCQNLIDDKKYIKDIPQYILKLLWEQNNLMRDSLMSFYKYDRKKQVEQYLKRKDILKKALEIYEKPKSTKRDCLLAHYLLTITQYISDVAAFVMTMEQ